MKKMTSYIVAGVKADDEAVFMQRVGELLERKGLLEYLTDGVPVDATIKNKELVMKKIMQNTKNALNVQIDKIYFDDFQVRISYSYDKPVYYSTQEKADEHSYNDYSSSKDEKHQIEGTYPSSSSINVNEKDGVEILYV